MKLIKMVDQVAKKDKLSHLQNKNIFVVVLECYIHFYTYYAPFLKAESNVWKTALILNIHIFITKRREEK